MLGIKNLKSRRIAVLAADGFEKIELTAPVAALRSQGAEVEIVSLHPGSIRGVNLHEPAGRVRVDRTVDEADPDDYDALLVPGGFINPDLLRQSAAAREFVRRFDLAGKPLATLCHGPRVLASAGLVRGRTMTSWPGMRDDLVGAGATWLDQKVVRDGNWITGRGPQDIGAFTRAMCALFARGARIPRGEARPRWPVPQWRQPPALVPAVMRLLPRPSARLLLGLAVLGAGILMASRQRQPVPA